MIRQNIIRVKNLNIPVRYFKLHIKKLREITIVDTPHYLEIGAYYSANIRNGTYLKLIIENGKYSVQFVEDMWVSYHLPDKLKKLDAWLNLMGYTYESYIQRI